MLRIFPDTNALLAMILFPTNRAGRITLAGEVKALYEQGTFEFVISRVVEREVLEVVARDFPGQRQLVERFLQPFENNLTRVPTSAEIRAVLPAVVDIEDAPIVASALLSQPDIVLSNDFETFHTERAKALWNQAGIQLESLYGLLCVFGKRRRKRQTN